MTVPLPPPNHVTTRSLDVRLSPGRRLVVAVAATGLPALAVAAFVGASSSHPFRSWSELSVWYTTTDPLAAAMIVAQLALVALAAHLVSLLAVGVCLRLRPSHRLLAAVDQFTIGAGRHLVRRIAHTGVVSGLLVGAPFVSGLGHPVAAWPRQETFDQDRSGPTTPPASDPTDLRDLGSLDPPGIASLRVLTSSSAEPSPSTAGPTPPEAAGASTTTTSFVVPPAHETPTTRPSPNTSAGGMDGRATPAGPPLDAASTDQALAPPIPADPARAEGFRSHQGPGSELLETWTITPGDHLWTVAEETLTDRWHRAPTDRETTRYWRRLIDHNRSRLVAIDHPDLVYAGQVFELPPSDEGSPTTSAPVR